MFDLAMQHSAEGDWLFVLDADMVPARNPRDLLTGEAGALAFRLYDLWGDKPLMYRHDQYWRGHDSHRVWAIRRPRDNDWVWPDRGIHSGHFPLNIVFPGICFAPIDYSILHFAYLTPGLRSKKHEQYMSVKAQLSPNELAHAQTIVDPAPRIYPLPFTPELKLELARTHERVAA